MFKRDGDCWSFRCVDSGDEWRTSSDGCTCPDFKFRHRDCKHLQVLRRFVL